MADELPTPEQAREEAARRTAFTDQMKARHTSDAAMLGNLRDALMAEGFSDRGAEEIVLCWFGDYIAFNHHMEMFCTDEDED